MSATEEWMSGPYNIKTIFDAKEAEKETLIIHNNPGDGSGDEAENHINLKCKFALNLSM